MKNFFNKSLILSIRMDSAKGLSYLSDIFSNGAYAAHLLCCSNDHFILIDNKDINNASVNESGTGLDAVFAEFNERKFIIEIYGDTDKSEKLSEIIKKHSMSDKVLLWTRNSALMKKIRNRMPEVATAMTPNEFLIMYFLYKSGFLFLKKKFKADCLLSIEAYGVSYILNKNLIKELSSREIFSIALTDSTQKQLVRLNEAVCRGYVLKDIEQFKIAKGILHPGL